MKTRTSILGIILTAMSFIGLFCAGTSETGNALTVVGTLADGSRPATCAKVHLVTDGYIPGNKASGNVFTTTTDETGTYTFTRIPPGDYYLNASKDSLNILRGPITLEDENDNITKDLAVDTLKVSARLTIAIPADKDIATVFIEGLTELWDVSNGTVTLEYVPSGTVTISAITSKGTTTLPEATTTVEVSPADTISTAMGNRPPVIVSPRTGSYFRITNADEAYTATIDAYDPESGTLTYSIITGPAGLQLDETTGTISWQLSSEIEETVYKVGILVSDPDDGTRSVWWNISFFWSTSDENLPPVITFLEGDTVSILYGDNDKFNYYLSAFTVTDPEGDLYTTFQPVDNVNLYEAGEYSVQYSASDEFGNTGTAQLTVLIVANPGVPDTIPPVLTLSDTVVTIQKSTEFTSPSYAAYDLVDGDVTDNVLVESDINTDKVGTYYVEYSVSDAAGNKTTAIVRVLVTEDIDADTVAPVITLLGNNPLYIDTLTSPSQAELIEYYTEPGYTASDNKDGDITDQVTTSTPEKNENGIWVITYSVEDAAGNITSITRLIASSTNIIGTSPIIELIYNEPILEIELGGTWLEPGYVATDIVDGDITDKVVVDTSELMANLSTIGTYSVTYTVTNTQGSTTSVIRTVRVVSRGLDITPPVITLLGKNPDTVLLGSSTSYIDPGATAVDDFDGDITENIIMTDGVSMYSFGKYAVTYSVQDSAGWTETATRIVYVVRDTLTEDLLLRYNVPAEEPFPTFNKIYCQPDVDGDGPDMFEIDSLYIDWNLEDSTLDSLAIFIGEQKLDLLPGIEHSLHMEYPMMKIAIDNEIEGLDNTYYVTINGDEFIWVEESGRFAIIWQEVK